MNFSEKKCLKKLILIAPGIFFHTNDKKMSPYFRMSYSSLTDDEMDSVSVVYSLFHSNFIDIRSQIFINFLIHAKMRCSPYEYYFKKKTS